MFLIAYIGEAQMFDVDAIGAGLRSSPGVQVLPPDKDYVTRFEYRVVGDVTTVEVAHDRMSIKIDGMGKASLLAALNIQRFSDRPVRIIDDGYAFDLCLTEFSSSSELYNAIISCGG